MKPIDRHEAFELASPFPYTLAVTLDERERPNIIGLSWWMFTSWSPLMIAISVGRERYSHKCLEHHKEFVLCFPSEEQAKDAWFCGTRSGKDLDKFQETSFVPLKAKEVDVPIIEGATVAYECKVVREVETGDHTLYIANVVNIHGDHEKARHLYSIHYKRLISLDTEGNVNLGLKY
ncbi:MAG: flavin reductase family protein [Nitrospirae bacterium]|nr:flavin reductase family protein [Nitrospirota bacterium]